MSVLKIKFDLKWHCMHSKRRMLTAALSVILNFIFTIKSYRILPFFDVIFIN